jgi:hypothetical protein
MLKVPKRRICYIYHTGAVIMKSKKTHKLLLSMVENGKGFDLLRPASLNNERCTEDESHEFSNLNESFRK